MNIEFVGLGLLLTIAGCSAESERSRVVAPIADSKPASTEPGTPVIKDSRRIATH